MPMTPETLARSFKISFVLTTSRTSAGVASLLALLIAALSKIVGSSVDNDSAAQDALGSNELNKLVADLAICIALSVSLEVAKISDMAVLVGWSTVLLAVGVDWSLSKRW